MDLNDMIKYYYSSAKIRQENSKNVINREVTSAKDDIQVGDPRTSTEIHEWLIGRKWCPWIPY